MTLSQRILESLVGVEPTLKAELEVGLEAMAVITAANLTGTELFAMQDALVEYAETWAVIGRVKNPAYASFEASMGDAADKHLESVIAEPVVAEIVSDYDDSLFDD